MWVLDLFSAVMFFFWRFGDNAFGAVLSVDISVAGLEVIAILIPFWLSLCDSFE